MLPVTCRNHPDVETEARCEACGLPFCRRCLVRIRGRSLCGPCKRHTVREVRRRTGVGDREADEALAFSLMAMVPCFSPLVAPFALWKSLAALRAYRMYPDRPGRGKAVTAAAIAGLVLLAWGIGVGIWLLQPR